MSVVMVPADMNRGLARAHVEIGGRVPVVTPVYPVRKGIALRDQGDGEEGV